MHDYICIHKTQNQYNMHTYIHIYTIMYQHTTQKYKRNTTINKQIKIYTILHNWSHVDAMNPLGTLVSLLRNNE